LSYSQTDVDEMYVKMLRKIIDINGVNKDNILKSLKESVDKVRNDIYELENEISSLKRDEITYEDLINYLKQI